MLKKIVVGLALLLTLGCAQRLIVQDKNGITIPKETITMTNPETGITVEALFIRMVEVSPESYYPTFLSPHKINKISMQQLTFTKEIMLFVRIHNPNKEHYRMTKRLRFGDKPENFKDRILFEGNAQVKHFQLLVPKEFGKYYQVMAMIDYGGNFPMLRIGYFDILYKDSDE
jgi:hypothetical protein